MISSFLGKLLYICYGTLRRKDKFYGLLSMEQIDIVGLKAIPIVMLLNFLIGAVLTQQGLNVLKDYGQLDKIPDVMGPTYFRYVGSLITAIIVAGRSGSSFAAEIGSMKLNQEIDALRSMRVEPTSMIVLPRVLATFLSLPVLTTLAIIAGVTGGAFIAWLLIDMDPRIFFLGIQGTIALRVYLLTLLKTLVFGVTIAFIGCYRGLCVKDNAQVLGAMTTKSVVECIFWVIVFDGILSTYYSYLEI